MQALAVDLLIYLDSIAAGEEEERSVYTALSASGRFDPKKLFPEYFPDEDEDVEVVDDDGGEFDDEGDVDYDYTGVSWRLPSEGADADELRDLMGANEMVEVTEEEARRLVLPPSDPDEREWL